jgi:hypothetical protein
MASPVFQSNRTVALIPKDARHKKQLRLVLAAFAEQFVGALVGRLTTYCELRKSKTVDTASLRRAAEELLGAGASQLPSGLSEDQLPQTIIYARFKRSLGGLRTDAGCSSMAGIVGFHFLRYVQDTIERVYTPEADARSIKVADVIAALERPGKFSPSGLPTIAYRHNDAIFEEAVAAPETATTATTAAEEEVAEATAAAEKPAKKGKGAKKEAQKVKEEQVVEEAPAAAAAATAAPTKRKAKAATKAAAAEAAPSAEAEPAPKKRRGPSKKAAAAAAAASSE